MTRGLVGGVAAYDVANPAQHAHILAEAWPDERAIVVGAEPVDLEDPRRTARLAPISSQWPSSRPCCSRRTAASPSGRCADTPTAPVAAAVVSETMRRANVDAVLPAPCARRPAAPLRAAAAEEDGRDRYAPRILPVRGRHSGTASPATVKREFGWAAGPVPVVQGLPCQSVRCSGAGPSMPSHQTAVRRSRRNVGEDGVRARRRASRSDWSYSWCPARRRRSRPRG